MTKPTEQQIQAAAASLTNARLMRNGSPPIANVLDLLPANLRTQVWEDAADALTAAFAVGENTAAINEAAKEAA